MDASTVVVKVVVTFDDSVVGSFGAEVVADRVTSVSGLLSAVASKLRMEALRSRHPNAYQPWTTAEEERLAALHAAGSTVGAMSAELGRNQGAIRSRLDRMGLPPPG